MKNELRTPNSESALESREQRAPCAMCGVLNAECSKL